MLYQPSYTKWSIEITREFVDHQDFNPVYAIIATWDHVGYYNRKIDKASVLDKIISCILHSNFRPLTTLVQTSQPEIYIDSETDTFYSKINPSISISTI